MASYRGHLAGGVAFTGAYVGIMALAPVERLAEYAQFLNDWQTLTALFVVGMLFALFPDVDTKSKGQMLFFWSAFLLDALLIWRGYFQTAAYLGVIAMLPIISKHRGWTHSLWAMFVIPLPIVLIPYLYSEKMLPLSFVYYGAAVVGYFSHLFFDGLITRRFRLIR